MAFFKRPYWTTALSRNTTGSQNTAIGANADISAGNLTNATAIGANAIVNASNKIRLGDANVTLVETAGNLRVGAGSFGGLGCVQDGDGTVIAGTCASDTRLETDISAFAPLLDKLVQLQPVYFYWKAEEYSGGGSDRREASASSLRRRKSSFRNWPQRIPVATRRSADDAASNERAAESS